MRGWVRSARGQHRPATAVLVAVLATTISLIAAFGTVIAPAARAADSAPYRATVFERGYDTGKVVTLTFDADWWSAGNVATILQVLRDNQITAGFGLTGRFVEKYPNETRAIVNAGHKLINHSYDHPYFLSYDPDRGRQLTQADRWWELDKAEAAYNKLGLTSAGWFRAPYRDGYADPGVNRDLALRGYYISFDWTFDTTGYQGASTAVILDRVRRYTVPGAIIVMHVGSESTDAQALPSVIATLKGMGYGFTSPYLTVTKGAVRGRYVALGAQQAVVGVPRTAEMVATTTGTAVQWFARGRIYWASGLGAFEVRGSILTKYRSLGTVMSLLRFPTTDERGCLDRVGRYNHFQGGSIYWTSGTGAHEVHGGIGAKWASLGWERGLLRYPVSDEVAVTGGRASQFQGGNIYWSQATGAHEVHGGILARYLQLGGSASRLGLPVSDEYSVSAGRRSDFQHGSILWNATTRVVTVIYR
jgi:peptidoglycan/xylan/chitin deacetylase (PgdA/CDA1 family)